MINSQKTSIVALGFLIILMMNPAFAHKPISSDGSNTTVESALEISDHKISWAIYEELEKFQTKYYTFDAKKGDQFYSSIVIPKLERLEAYSPSIALVGEGIEIQNVHDLGIELPLGGAVVYNYNGQIPSKEFYEPFAQTTYWERQEIKISIPHDGKYYIVVFDSKGVAGKYSLAIGTIEDFSMIDFVTVLPSAWFTTKIFFEDYLSPLIFVGSIAGIGIGIFVIKRRN